MASIKKAGQPFSLLMTVALLLLLLLLNLPVAAGFPSNVNSTISDFFARGPPSLDAVASSCGCYSTSGGTSALYTNYFFADFNDQTPLDAAPPLPVSPAGLEGVTSSLFDGGWFAENFIISSYAEPANSGAGVPLENAYSKANVWITQDAPGGGTYARLRSGRASPSFQSSAEISTSFPLYHASMRMLARVGGTSSPYPPGGVVATMFTYLSTPSQDNESDMELLTSGPLTQLHATNQPHNTHIVTLPDGMGFQDWIEYRMDWVAGDVQWSANGNVLVTNNEDVPALASRFLWSVWSNGGGWSGEMGEVGQQAWMDVQWVELGWNVSGAMTSCQDVGICAMRSQ